MTSTAILRTRTGWAFNGLELRLQSLALWMLLPSLATTPMSFVLCLQVAPTASSAPFVLPLPPPALALASGYVTADESVSELPDSSDASPESVLYLPLALATFSLPASGSPTPPPTTTPALGCVLRAETDHEIDGSVDHRSATLYDDVGYPLVREHWRNPLDTEVRRKREYWAYNATGALALWTRHGQGEEVVALSYSYDSEGRVARRQGHRDWQPDSVTRYRYDPSGRLQQLDSDIDSDGAVDDVTRFDYSDSGRLVHERYYEGASATVPSVVVTYTWESDRVVALDVGQWGQKPEGGERLTYDAQRRLERRDMIAPGSPVTDWIEYEYGKDGLLSQVRSYRLGEWHDSWDYQYNHWGLLTQEEFHSTFEPSYVTRYQYELCTLPPRNPDPADCLIPLWCQLFPQPSYAISE